MIKNYDEDKQESKIIFDDSSIEKINRIIENHEILFVEFPLYEIQITKKSINQDNRHTGAAEKEDWNGTFSLPNGRARVGLPSLAIFLCHQG